MEPVANGIFPASPLAILACGQARRFQARQRSSTRLDTRFAPLDDGCFSDRSLPAFGEGGTGFWKLGVMA